MAEALGLRESALLASSMGDSRVLFETDCQNLIEACRGNAVRGEISMITKDIQAIKNQFERRCGFTWVGREGNQSAHTIASLAREGSLVVDW